MLCVQPVSLYLLSYFHVHRFSRRSNSNKTIIGVGVLEAPIDVYFKLTDYEVLETITPEFLSALAVNFQNNKICTMLFLMGLSNKANIKNLAIIASVFEGR